MRRKERISGQRRARITVFTNLGQCSLKACVCVCVCVCMHMCAHRGYSGSLRSLRSSLSHQDQERQFHPWVTAKTRGCVLLSQTLLERGPRSFYRTSLDLAKNHQALKIQPLLTHITHQTLPIVSPKAFTLAPFKHGTVPTFKLCSVAKIEATVQDLQATATLENCLVAKGRNIYYKVALPVSFCLGTIINKLKEEATYELAHGTSAHGTFPFGYY